MRPRNRESSCVVIGLAAAFSAAALGQVQEETRLTPRQPITSDILGYGMDFDGTTVVAGAPFGTHSGFSQPGRAFVFRLVDGVWRERLLLPSTLQENGWFGLVCTVDGATIAVGAPGEHAGGINQAGAVYIFERSGGSWTETAKLSPPDRGDTHRFGSAVALQGDRLVVGALGASFAGPFTGAVYVYERSGGVWMQSARLTASDAGTNDTLGTAVDVDGDTLAAGALNADVQGVHDAGKAYVFSKVGGVWQEVGRLIASDYSAESEFGTSVAILGSTAIVGAPSTSAGGAAYVYRDAGGDWPEQARLTPEDLAPGDAFGQAVTLDGDNLLIGAFLAAAPGGGTGLAHLYRNVAGTWEYTQKIQTADHAGVLLGWTAVLKGDRAAMSGPFWQLNQGAVYTFTGFAPCDPCDANCDGGVDAFDIEPFIDVVFNGAQPCGVCACDVNGDGQRDAFDIEPFVSCLFP